ncbi:hypothetical protein KVR01_013088 [Diaporthe batatas]|uniref:uncharacterized protein n=1 Tax=Diaporthe batatas TaxID=748121 RepID=UPI001D04E0EC|nr:uncharacterized protein KVR01_013088 [Diaporthe batatas]KAG8157098.1 hypothetical protein KVR01_013088 [Diaporthe batatas]
MESTQNQSVATQELGLTLRYAESTRGSPSATQWLQYQPLMKRLYVIERRTLWDIMQTMRRDYGFEATAKMYKSRFKAWGFRKNIRLRAGEDEDLIQVLREKSQPSGQSGSQTGNFLLRNGQLVPQDRLVKHLRRRGEGGLNTNKHPTTRAIRPPDTIHISEALLFQVRSYVRGTWEEAVSTAEQLDNLREERPNAPACNALAHGVRYALEQKNLNNALVLMRRAPGVLAELMALRTPNTLYVLFMSLAYFTAGGLLSGPEAAQFLVVVRHLIKYVAVFVAKDQALPSTHPIRQMLALLANADEKEIYQLATKAWFVNCQSWDGLMDSPRSTYAIASWISYGEFNGFNAMPSNLGNIIELTLEQNAAKYGEYHRRTTHTLQMYSMYLTYRDRANGRDPYFNMEIVSVFEDLLRRGPQGLLRADALSWLAKASKARGDRDSAERYMRDLINFLLEDDNHRNSLARGFMNDLESWFIEWEDTQKAAELAEWREEELGSQPTA